MGNGWYTPAEVKIPFSALVSALLPASNHFEQGLSRFLEVERCICAGSGRALLTLLLKSLWHRAGEQRNEILIPGYTCYSVAASVVRAGLRIRVYDLDPETFHPDLESAKQGINDKTLAIVVQHLFGIPCPMEGMKDLSDEAGACLIEDASQALGGTLGGLQLGTIADYGFYSFGRGKPLPLGSGGALVGRDLAVMNDITLPRKGSGYGTLLITAAVQVLSHRKLYGIMEALPLGLGDTIFDPDFALSFMSPAIRRLGEKVLGFLEILNEHRRAVAGVYSNLLKDYGVIPVQDKACPIYTRFPLMAGHGCMTGIPKRFGVRRLYPRALVDEPRIRSILPGGVVKTPGASQIAEKLITLPTHTGISLDMAARISHELEKETTLFS